MSDRNGSSSRWGGRRNHNSNESNNHHQPSRRYNNNHRYQQQPPPSTSTGVDDEAALEALLASAEDRKQKKEAQQSKARTQRRRWDNGGGNGTTSTGNSNGNGNGNDRRGRSDDAAADPKTDYYRPQSKRQRQNNRENEKDDSKFSWGGPGENLEAADKEAEDTGPAVEPEKPNFGLSGALAGDDKTGNVYNGILLKFSEPPEARVPNTRWRLYVFKKKPPSQSASSNKTSDDDGGELVETLHISKQSAYLFGRETKVADIAVHHPSLSKQHCVLQYRALPDRKDPGNPVRCKPYLMDLKSTNGTFINGFRLEDARYYELRKGDVITLGSSSREYVLLTENTTSTDLS